MADIEVPLAPAESLVQQARERIEESIARLGGDSAAFWHAVALSYRRGLADPALAEAESANSTHRVCLPSAEPEIAVGRPVLVRRLGVPVVSPVTGWILDVIATPLADETTWWLTDRSGDSLGAVQRTPGSSQVSIVAGSPSALEGILKHHPSIDAAFRAIAEHLGGTCELNPTMKGYSGAFGG
ncbi:hypothetical protein [Methylobacterium oryzisoli]|uniref:hypothetical protein n=1 Tax=Methylobacterium oryzisoli TaxID=3385502 RepID=UPI003892AB51